MCTLYFHIFNDNVYLKQKHPLVILTHGILENFILYYLPLFYKSLYQ